MIDLSWIHGALIYFYTKAQTQPKLQVKKRIGFIYSPLSSRLALVFFVRLQNLYWDGTKESLSWLGYYGYVVWMNNATIYIIASALIIFYTYKSEELLRDIDANFEIPDKKLVWIKRIIRSFLVYFSAVLLVLLIDSVYTSVNGGSILLLYPFLLLPILHWYSCIDLLDGLRRFSRRNDPELSIKSTATVLEELERLRVISELQHAMEVDKIYKDQDLSLNSLAKQLDMKPYLNF